MAARRHMTATKAAGADAPAPAPEDESKAFIEDMKRRDFNTRVNREFELYLDSGDGRFLWRAFLLLHEAGQPIPQNLLDKLAQWGGRLLTAKDPREIAAALELSGAKHSAAYRKRWRLAMEVNQVKELFNLATLKEAIEVVARNRKLKFSVVENNYHSVFTADAGKNKPRDAEHALTGVMNTWGR